MIGRALQMAMSRLMVFARGLLGGLAGSGAMGIAACALLAMVLGVVSAPAFAQTQVSGAILTNATWSASQSPYLVTSDITIDHGATLTIEAGVTVYMAANTGLEVKAGSLQALGSAAAPIAVLSDKARLGQSAAAGDWKQWSFTSGTTNTHLANLVIRHGRGLVATGATVVLDNVTIEQHLGPAVTADLAAGLSGSGNQASGNTLNAVVIPAGEITGTVRFGLKGIPYLLPAGILSVGRAPTLNSVSPGTLMAGETKTLTVSGTRLAGVRSAVWTSGDVTSQVLAGGTDTQFQLQTTAAVTAKEAVVGLTVMTDAGEASLPSALLVQVNQPLLTGVVPASMYTNVGDITVTLSGEFFAANSVVQMDGQSLATTFDSATQLRAVIPQQTTPGSHTLQLSTPDPRTAGAYLTSNGLAFSVIRPTPTFSVETASMMAGNSQTITVHLPVAAPAGGMTCALTSDSPAIATAPASILVAAGQAAFDVVVLGAAIGQTKIHVSCPQYTAADLPVAVIAPPVTLNYTPVASALVGVNVGTSAQAAATSLIVSPDVGVVTGPFAKAIAPSVGIIGSQVALTIAGHGLTGVTSVELQPADGIVLGVPVVAGDGESVSVAVTIDAAAALGVRRVILRGANGIIPFSTPWASQFLVSAPVPQLEWVSPQVVLANGTATQLTIHGRNFRNLTSLRFDPPDQLSLQGSYSASEDGTVLTATLVASASAASGLRTVIVSSAAGESTSVQSPGNAFQVAHTLGAIMRDMASPIVGVVVGSATPTPAPLAVGPVMSAAVGVLVGAQDGATPPLEQASQPVGVLVGPAAIDMSPRAGAIGTSVNLTITGAGLEGVTAVSVVPATGISVSNLMVDPGGTSLSVTLTVDAQAAKTVRGIELKAGTVAIPFVVGSRSQFQVTNPQPQIDSIAPQLLLPGQSGVLLTVRGHNLQDVTGVRFEPPQGVSAPGLITQVGSNGEQIQVSVNVAADAVPGPRTLVAVSPSAESSDVASPSNTFQIISQKGGTYQDLVSPLVGVLVPVEPAAPDSETVVSTPVGVVLGPAVLAVSPTGAVTGSSGTLTLSGVGLDVATAAALVPAVADGTVTLGTPSVAGDGSTALVAYSVASNAASASHRVALLEGSGPSAKAMPAPNAAALIWRVLDEPVLNSFTPLVTHAGQSFNLVIRGANLKEVTRIRIEPEAGIQVSTDALVWASDGLGETLTAKVVINPGAATGARVVRLEYPGGATAGQSTTANTMNVTAP